MNNKLIKVGDFLAKWFMFLGIVWGIFTNSVILHLHFLGLQTVIYHPLLPLTNDYAGIIPFDFYFGNLCISVVALVFWYVIFYFFKRRIKK